MSSKESGKEGRGKVEEIERVEERRKDKWVNKVERMNQAVEEEKREKEKL